MGSLIGLEMDIRDGVSRSILEYLVELLDTQSHTLFLNGDGFLFASGNKTICYAHLLFDLFEEWNVLLE